MSNEQVLLVEKQDGVAIVTVNRPEVLNVMNEHVFEGFVPVFKDLAHDDDVKVIILTGAGQKAFVAGSDIGFMASMTAIQQRPLNLEFHRIFNYIESIEKPVIAAINGYALGGGCELSLCCDIRIASDNAKFALPEVGLGIIPGSGGTQRLTKLIGKSNAKYMILTGEKIPASKALEFGLVNEVVSQEELMPRCLELAKQMAKNPVLSLALAKKAINVGAEIPTNAGLEYENSLFTIVFGSDDKKERMDAFLNKKK